MNRVWAALVFVLGGCGVAFADPAATDAALARVGVSVVRLADMENGEEKSQGSGFFVAPGVIATNHHVVDELKGELVALMKDGTKMVVRGVLADDEVHDLALLRVDGDGPPPLPLAPVATLAVRESVTAIGSPLGLDQTFSTGIISALRDGYPPDWKHAGTVDNEGPLVQHTASIAPGSSGSPLVDDLGHVVGVNQSGIELGAIGFAVRVDVLAALIAKTDLRAKPKNLGADVRRNLVISAAFLVALALALGVAAYVSKRHAPRARPKYRA